MEKTALAVMRLQPLHEGHTILIDAMLDACERVIIGIGSTQESGTERNPYSYEERRVMLLERYGDRENLTIIPLVDIGAQSKQEWVDYVLGELDRHALPHPTHYFSGSRSDADWYTETGWEIVIIDRETVGKGISATKIRETMRKSRN